MNEHIKIELDFIPVGEKQMPRGIDFMIIYRNHGNAGWGEAFIEQEADVGPTGMIWHPSMNWSYDECEDLTITHWAEIPKIGE